MNNTRLNTRWTTLSSAPKGQSTKKKIKTCLNNELEPSLKLEMAMLQLQQEFRQKSQSISNSVDKLGKLLGIERMA